MSNNLYWLLSFYKKQYDTGLCNRIFYWEIADYINHLNDYKFQIVLENEIYHEFENNLILPNTIFKDREKIDGNVGILFRKIDKSVNSIDLGEVGKLVKNEKKLEDGSYKFRGEFFAIDQFIDLPDYRPLSKIRIKNPEIESFITETAKDYVGIHVRRWHGVNVTPNSFDELDEKLKPLYKSLFKQKDNIDLRYPFFSDVPYFKIISKILEHNPNQKIYVSHDLPDDFLMYWKTKFGDNIQFRNDFLHLFDLDTIDKKNIFDLFFVGNTKFFIGSPSSTWSEFARYHKPKIHSSISESTENIFGEYIKIA
jgi:hypothetical protein